MKYAKNFLILLSLMLLNTMSFSQDKVHDNKADGFDRLGKATVTFFGGKTSDPPALGFSYVKATTFSCDLIYSAIDGVISLLDHHGNPLPQDSILKVSMIQGTGEDFGFTDVSVAGLMFKIFRPNLGGPYIIQKMLAVEMKALENLRPWTYFEMEPPTYHPLSAYGMVNEKKYLISMELALAKGFQGQGKYLIMRNVSVVPADETPNDPDKSWYERYIVKYYMTFQPQASSELVRYPSLRTTWSRMVDGQGMLHRLPDQMDNGYFNGNYIPAITILVTRKGLWDGESQPIGRFDLSSGSAADKPKKPLLAVIEKEFTLQLNWTPETNALNYKLYRSNEPISEIAGLPIFQTISGTTIEDNTVIPGKQYFYRVLPVRIDGLEGLISEQVMGVATSPIVLSVNNVQNEPHEAGSLFNITGTVNSSKTGQPIVNPLMNATIEDLNHSFEPVIGNANGFFSVPVEAPAVSGLYSYYVTTNDIVSGNGKVVNFSSRANPATGHDISIESLSSGSLLKNPGQTFGVTLTYKNNGKFTENGQVVLQLFDDNNNPVGSPLIVNFTINTGNSTVTINQNVTIPTGLANGNYYVKAISSIPFDENNQNDFKRSTFYISAPIADPPCYRLEPDDFDSVNDSRVIDGFLVKLVNATATSATFTVNGESTGELVIDSWWVNSNGTYMLAPTSFIYVADTNLNFDVRAGAVHNNVSYSPFHLTTKKNDTSSVFISAPTGSNLNTSVMFVKDPDNTFMTNWLLGTPTYGNNSNELVLKFKVPKNEASRTYYSYLKIIDTNPANNYWWVKRLYITPLKGHEIKTEGMLTIQNITANGLPGTLTGDRFSVSGSFKNLGDFNENVPLRLTFSKNDTTWWYENMFLAIAKSHSETFSLILPTLGLKPGNYQLKINAAEPEDYAQTNKIFVQSQALDQILQSTCYFEPLQVVYEPEDTIRLKLHLEHAGVTLPNGSVQFSITTPSGNPLIIPAIYQATTSTYDASFLANLSGNYYITANTSARRYNPCSSSAIAKVLVNLAVKKLPGAAIKGNSDEYMLVTSNVGGIYAVAGDIQYSQHFSLIDFKEGTILNANETVPTSFNYNLINSQVTFGITRLNPCSLNSIAISETSLLYFNLLNREPGNGTIQVVNFGLLDSRGEPMVCNLPDCITPITYDTLYLKIEPSDTIYKLGDTLRLISAVVGSRNLKAISFELLYNDTLLKYLDTKFDNSFGDYGVVPLINNAYDNGKGKVYIGCARANDSLNGSSLSVIRFADTRFLVLRPDSLVFGASSVHMLSPIQDLEFYHQIHSKSAIAISYDPHSPMFDPDTMLLSIDSTAWSSLKMKSVVNAYSCSAELSYDTSAVRILQLTQGNLFNMDGNPADMQYYIDSVQGKVYFGITRLAPIFWGVSSDTTHILFNLKIKKKSDQLSKILSPSFEIIDALGISQSSYFKPQLTFGYTGPPTNNYITNKTITNGQNYCYDALQTITIAGNGTTFKLMNGGMVNLIAGQKIIFLPGTLVQSGGQLKAWITTNGGYCNSLYNKSTLPPLPGDSLGGYSTDKGFFIVYPNPSTGNIWLKLLNENLPCDVELYLYNFIGKKLEQRKLTISSTVQISLNSLNPGIYFVRMVKGELTGVAKIVKL